MSQTVSVGVVGDYNPSFASHPATNHALERAARKLGVEIEIEWVPTPRVTAENAEEVLDRFDGLWMAPGSPYRSMQGALAAIRFARERNRPFVGT